MNGLPGVNIESIRKDGNLCINRPIQDRDIVTIDWEAVRLLLSTNTIGGGELKANILPRIPKESGTPANPKDVLYRVTFGNQCKSWAECQDLDSSVLNKGCSGYDITLISLTTKREYTGLYNCFGASRNYSGDSSNNYSIYLLKLKSCSRPKNLSNKHTTWQPKKVPK